MQPLNQLREYGEIADGTLCTTYTFDPRHFEELALPAFRKNDGTVTTVFVDQSAYSDTLDTTEITALNRTYFLSPVNVPGRRFHPKVWLFTSDTKVTAFVGSMNLTQRGLTSNREILKRFELHRKELEAGDHDPHSHRQIISVIQFFDQLIASSFTTKARTIAHQRAEAVLDQTEWVTSTDYTSATSERELPTICHNLDRPLVNAVSTAIDAVDSKLQHVDIVSPFYGHTTQVPDWFRDLGVTITLWIQSGKTEIDSDQLADLLRQPSVSIATIPDKRYTHGKLYQLQFQDRTLCVFGSANASASGMLASAGMNQQGTNGNVEVLSIVDVPSSADSPLDHSPFRDQDVYEALPSSLSVVTPSYESSKEHTAEQTQPEIFELRFEPDHNKRTGELLGYVMLPASLMSETCRLSVLFETPAGHSVSVSIPERHITRTDSGDHISVEFATSMLEKEVTSVLSQCVKATVEIGPHRTDPYWLEIDSPSQVESRRTTPDAGGRGLVGNLEALFGDDDDRRTNTIDFLRQLQDRRAALDGVAISSRGKTSESKSSDGSSKRVSRGPTLSGFDGGGNDETSRAVTLEHVTEFKSQVRSYNKKRDTETDDVVFYYEQIVDNLEALNITAIGILAHYNYRSQHGPVEQANILSELSNKISNEYRELYSNRMKVGGRNEWFVDSILAETVSKMSVSTFDDLPSDHSTGPDWLHQFRANVALAMVTNQAMLSNTKRLYSVVPWAYESVFCQLFVGNSPVSVCQGDNWAAFTERIDAIVESVLSLLKGDAMTRPTLWLPDVIADLKLRTDALRTFVARALIEAGTAAVSEAEYESLPAEFKIAIREQLSRRPGTDRRNLSQLI